ncbi:MULTISPECIES: thiol:disulfide interchange protein DsbG [Marinobacter]|jgi:thiol:disulfide interchange protein DsbG|uniref:thiol:disulfide interchange protein DsbG n=2 Tax=Marinobacter TaxID=2742 RepID=UPI000948E312|nr:MULTISPECIES: thiol:disulfide interchange protein DsbG [unclassified Marinobacter]MBL3827375.1 thiol:disulfide interchange protein DsbG [Marinobacter sp. MC3]RUT74223.1 thiol:disulfide interchange protein DsbG [Marinobacter sp. NP-6]MAB53036.1 thiol:disulfide interchange protein DsbG [Marinobacter sp.]MBL3895874.1 thiol:disulfide interchange protein DsbG [Marinobacter sp. MW3]OLF85301.1 Fis family transcriptional regulator [Marinobacter sp. C18]
MSLCMEHPARGMTVLFRKLSIALFLSLFAALAYASPTMDPGIEALQKKVGFTVIERFSTPVGGVTGYVVKTGDGKAGIIYGVGDYTFSGALLESDGTDLTRQYTTRYISEPMYASVAEKLSRDTHLVSEGGKNAPEIYVFADPNCIFCHKFWQQTRDWVAQGKVRLHWVMVGFLKPSSLGFSAAIMNAEDRAGALQAFEENFGNNGSGEGISELTPVPANLKAALEQHSKWMAELGFSGTPGLLFKDTSGQWQGQTGVPGQEALGRALGIAE